MASVIRSLQSLGYENWPVCKPKGQLEAALIATLNPMLIEFASHNAGLFPIILPSLEPFEMQTRIVRGTIPLQPRIAILHPVNKLIRSASSVYRTVGLNPKRNHLYSGPVSFDEPSITVKPLTPDETAASQEFINQTVFPQLARQYENVGIVERSKGKSDAYYIRNIICHVKEP